MTTTLKAFGRSVVRPAIRKLGYDMASAEALRDTATDLRHAITNAEPTIFDVGANNGDTVRHFRKLFPNSTVHAFEPGSMALANLRRNVGTDRHVIINDMALGDKAGPREFRENESTVMSSFLDNGTMAFGGATSKRTVNVSTIDTYCTDHKIDAVDLVKIDVQGFDLNVLNGAARMVAEKRIGAVLLEVTFIELYKGAAPAHELLGKMHDTGFEVAGLYNFSYRRNRLGWMDALFVKST